MTFCRRCLAFFICVCVLLRFLEFFPNNTLKKKELLPGPGLLIFLFYNLLKELPGLLIFLFYNLLKELPRFLIFLFYNLLKELFTKFHFINILILYTELEDSFLLVSNSNNQGDNSNNQGNNSNDNGSNTNNGGSDSDEEYDSDISEPLSDTDSVRGTSRVMDALDLLDKARQGDPQAKKEIEEKYLEGRAATEENLDE